MKKRVVSMGTIARAAGVSGATVSYVLNGRAPEMGIPKATQERISSLAEELGYKRNLLARGLRVGKTHILGLVVPDISNPFHAEVASVVEREAHRRNYRTFLCNSLWRQELEIEYVRQLMQYQIDGLIIAPVEKQHYHLLESLNSGIPIVFIDTAIPEVETDYVTNDLVAGGYMAAEYLIKLGHKRIGHISGAARFSYFSSFRALIEGYKRAHIDHNLPIDENLIVDGGLTIPAGMQAAKDFLRMEAGPTAIFAVNDMVALGAMSELGAAGLRVPEDVAIIGIDDVEVASLPSVALTTVSQPKREIGRKAVEILVDKIENPEVGGFKQLSLKPELIIRSSCGELH